MALANHVIEQPAADLDAVQQARREIVQITDVHPALDEQDVYRIQYETSGGAWCAGTGSRG